jgi:hypothetical protein
VDEIVLVQVQNRAENLFHDITSHFFGKSMRIHNPIEELSSIKILRNNKKVFVILIELEHFDDIWVVLTYQKLLGCTYQILQDCHFLH